MGLIVENWNDMFKNELCMGKFYAKVLDSLKHTKFIIDVGRCV